MKTNLIFLSLFLQMAFCSESIGRVFRTSGNALAINRVFMNTNLFYCRLKEVKIQETPQPFFNHFDFSKFGFGLNELSDISANANMDFVANIIEEKEVLVVLMDVLGNENYAKVVVTKNEDGIYVTDNSKKLSPGIYMVTASGKNRSFNRKMIIE